MSRKSQNSKEPSTKAVPKPRKRDRSASEERLIKAGLEIFSKYGFNAATTKLIAQKAGVNESLIARYFDGKEGLLISIFQSFVLEVLHRELPYPPQKTLSEELKHYIRDRIKTGCGHADFVHIIISHSLVDKKFKKKARETITLQVDPKLINRVRLLSESGKIVAANVDQICEEVDTYMDGLFFFDGILHEKPQEELIQKADRFLDNYCRLYEKK